MNLNLGLESLNNTNSAVVPFSPASMLEMQNASEAITNLMTSLENYYDAARNAMLVKKAVKKYGKTQSIIALIGQEGLAAAQSFSMEGFWEKTKDFLWKIWSKIKEWWGRFWGLFFSIEDRLRNFSSSLSGKVLVSDCEFDAPGPIAGSNKDSIQGRSAAATTAIEALKTCSTNAADTHKLAHLQALASTATDTHGSTVSEGSFATHHYKYTKLQDIKSAADTLVTDVFAKHRNSKKDIDRYTDEFLRKIKDIKIDAATHNSHVSGGNIFGRGAGATMNASDSSRDMTASENDDAVKIIKMAAKVNNQLVSSTLKAATTVGVKLMANTRTKNA